MGPAQTFTGCDVAAMQRATAPAILTVSVASFARCLGRAPSFSSAPMLVCSGKKIYRRNSLPNFMISEPGSACRRYRAEDACRACQCLCGLRALDDAGCAGCRSGALLSLPQPRSSLELGNLQGMGSPATADEADDSYRTLGVGRSLPGSHYTRQ